MQATHSNPRSTHTLATGSRASVLFATLVTVTCLGTLARAGGSPDAPTPSTNRVMLGKLIALDQSIVAAIDGLEESDARRIAQAVQQLGISYDAASAAVQDAFRDAGRAMAGIEYANALLEHDQPLAPDAIHREHVSAVRQRLKTELARLYELHRSDSPKAADDLQQMQELMNQISDLDQLLEDGGRSSDHMQAGDVVAGRLDTVQSGVEQEMELLQLQATSIRGLVEQAMADIDSGLRLMEINDQLPVEELARLTGTRRQLRKLIDLVGQSRQTAAHAAVHAVNTECPPTSRGEGAVIRHVRQVLGVRCQAPPSTGCPPRPSVCWPGR